MADMASLVQKTLTIVNRRGLHARAAAKFTKLAAKFRADITVQRGTMTVPGRSLMGLLTLGAGKDKEILITCAGEDAALALDALSDLITRGFDEDDNDGT